MSYIKTEQQWDSLVKADTQFHSNLQQFLQNQNKIEILRKQLLTGERTTAINVATYLKIEDLKSLFNELVFLASFVHGQLQTVRELILLLPKEWLVQNIERAAEPILAKGTYEEYRRLLELYEQINSDLLIRLVNQALTNTNSDIQEVGHDFGEKVHKTLYLPEIPSDSTIRTFKVENDTAKVSIELYTEAMIEVEFKKCYSLRVYNGGLGEIECVGVKASSNLLKETETILKGDQEPFEKLYSFQFGNSYDNYSIIEVISDAIFINGQRINLSNI